MLARWLGQLSADQFASRCVRPIMRHVDAVAPQLVKISTLPMDTCKPVQCVGNDMGDLSHCQACCMGKTFQDTRDKRAAS